MNIQISKKCKIYGFIGFVSFVLIGILLIFKINWILWIIIMGIIFFRDCLTEEFFKEKYKINS